MTTVYENGTYTGAVTIVLSPACPRLPCPRACWACGGCQCPFAPPAPHYWSNNPATLPWPQVTC